MASLIVLTDEQKGHLTQLASQSRERTSIDTVFIVLLTCFFS